MKYLLIILNYHVLSHCFELETIYWDVKPFIFQRDTGEIDGIIPKILQAGQSKCANNTPLTGYIRKEPTRRSFFDLVRSDTPYGSGSLQNVSRSKALWVPSLTYAADHSEEEFLSKRNLIPFQLIASDKIAVIVPRYLVSLPNKILRGFLGCQQIFVFAVLLCILVSILIWAIDHRINDNIPDSFLRGVCSGFWWSFISMTTVGYGDIVPHSVIGRLGAVLWLFVGVMVGSLMTATMTQIVTTVSDLSVLGKTVSVLENSHEEKVASNDYRANIYPAESYEQVIALVREEKVFAAMINADVAAWYQDMILNDSDPNPLRIVQALPATLYINCYLSTDVAISVKKMFYCMYNNQDEVYNKPQEYFDKSFHVENLYIGDTSDLVRNSSAVQIIVGLVAGLLCFGVVFDFYTLKCTSNKTPQKIPANEKLVNSHHVEPCCCKAHMKTIEIR